MLRQLFILSCIALPLFAASQKTDVVILNNGDHITGEIKRLDMEILQFKTSAMSTLQIKWYHIQNIFAPDKEVQVELENKTKLFGSLDSTDIPNALRVVSAFGEFNIPIEQVVSIIQVKQVFRKRFSGSIGAGVSFTKASQVLQTNYDAFVSYTDEFHYSALDINSIQTNQPDRFTSKQDATFNFNRTTVGRQFATAFVAAQQNTELDMDRRIVIGGGYGVDLVHTNISRLRFILGAIGNQENTISESLRTNNGEGFVSMDARIFKYTDPEIYLTSNVNYYPSFTVAGRHRVEVNIKLRFELLNDFFLEFTYYENLDSKPASEQTAKRDYGIISSLKYTFGL